MNKTTKENLKGKLERKKEIERLSDKSLLVFTMALLCEVILIFLYSAFKNTYRPSLSRTLGWISLILFATFIILMVSGKRLDKKTLKNWGYFSLASSLCSFVIASNVIIRDVLYLLKLEKVAEYLFGALNIISADKGALAIMIGIAIYVVCSFIYYNIKINNLKKNK